MGLDALLLDSNVGFDYRSFEEKISTLKWADSHLSHMKRHLYLLL